ncbi:MAG: C40 family peptidase [Lachnospiraceae bacterium]|nr:C40 family peptidase [Lachnospiraceae bacterium]
MANYACQFVGNPYVWGGESLTNGADCSGFVKAVYAHFGVSLPHSSYSLRSVGYAVSASEMQPGDIICYEGHVAIYIGNGAIVHAASASSGIKISYNYAYRTVVAIRRIF